MVLWGPGEEASPRPRLLRRRAAPRSLAPPTSITDIVAIAKGASLMVSGDTGPLHIAAAVGTPIVALFGPTRAERNGPWSPVRHLDLAIQPVRVSLRALGRRRPQPCIDDIGVDEVMAAVTAV